MSVKALWILLMKVGVNAIACGLIVEYNDPSKTVLHSHKHIDLKHVIIVIIRFNNHEDEFSRATTKTIQFVQAKKIRIDVQILLSW
ncbi:DEKNAAC103781 [Brettanomyces naardenensis]|uniref:DEKNAAC103781 n=1 Tax=Brettanomyces naardenensis TaxID=13370 RepID=A0A448YPB5_BRENA|nr:DEKNAAC103781 [Brettanomyces naardenensis]